MRGIFSRLLSAHDWSSSWVLAQPRAVMSAGSESPPLSTEPRACRAMSALSLMALRSTWVIWPIFSSKVIALSNSSVIAAAASSSAFAAAAATAAIPGRSAVAERIHRLSERWSIVMVASRVCGGSRSGSATGGDAAAGPFFPRCRERSTSSTCQCHARSIWTRASTRPLRPGLFPSRRGLGRCRWVFLHLPGAHLGFRRGPAIFLTLTRGRRCDLLDHDVIPLDRSCRPVGIEHDPPPAGSKLGVLGREILGLHIPGSGRSLQVLLAAIDFALLGLERITASAGPERGRQLVIALDENLGRRAGRPPAALEAIRGSFLDREEIAVVQHARRAGHVLVHREADDPIAGFRVLAFLHNPGDVVGQGVPAGRRGMALFEVALDEIRGFLPPLQKLGIGCPSDLLGAAIQAVEGLLDVDVGDLADGLGAGLLLVNPARRVHREVGDVDPEIVNVGLEALHALDLAPDADVAGLLLGDDLLHLLQRRLGPR